MGRALLFAVSLLLAFSLARELQAPGKPPEKVVKPEVRAALVPRPTTTARRTSLVQRVIDGDTIELNDGQRVRYIGIDTPETKDRRKPVQCFGKIAAEKNRELVEGKEVRLVRDVSDRDRYGRLLRYVYVGNIFVNLELVEQGFAKNYSYPPDIAHQAEFRKAEREAREAKRGLWSECFGN